MAASAERSLEELAGNPHPEAAALSEASKEENEYNRLAAAYNEYPCSQWARVHAPAPRLDDGLHL